MSARNIVNVRKAGKHGWSLIYQNSQNYAYEYALMTRDNKYISFLRNGKLISGLYCGYCHKTGDKGVINLSDNNIPFCNACSKECDDCHKRAPLNTGWIKPNGKIICDLCFENNYVTCVKCTMPTLTILVKMINDRPMCEQCIAKYCKKCELCQNWAMPNERRGYVVCSRCTRLCNVHSHDYKPPMSVFGKYKQKNQLLIGLELEVEAKRSLAKLVNEHSDGYLYLKEDGSLVNGFEIVSFPATWDYLLSIKNEWKSLLEKLINNGAESFDPGTCGMHVHASRSSVSPFAQYKLQKLIYNNKDWWTQLASRDNEEYASFDDEDEVKEYAQIFKARGENSSRRYVALNFTRSTIEFRLFRGTLHFGSFWRNLEAVKSSISFLNEIKLNDSTMNRYHSYISDNRKDYPEMYEWCHNHPPISVPLIDSEENF